MNRTNSLVIPFPGQERLAGSIARQLQIPTGLMHLHHFPDGESLVRLPEDLAGRDLLIVCSLEQADHRAMPLMFLAETAREFGARRVGLIAPYLGYMRQDKRFHPGEAITSALFARFLSTHFDLLVTVDPHLHRHHSLDEIYTIPAISLHAADTIARWIGSEISNPVLIGPDEESEQWVAEVAARAGAPFTVLTKTRHGDSNVEVSVPEVAKYAHHTPVLVDDIISTGMTMIETTRHLLAAGMLAPVCVGVHAVFADDACERMQHNGIGRIVTCNTIPHATNGIDISPLLAAAIANHWAE